MRTVCRVRCADLFSHGMLTTRSDRWSAQRTLRKSPNHLPDRFDLFHAHQFLVQAADWNLWEAASIKSSVPINTFERLSRFVDRTALNTAMIAASPSGNLRQSKWNAVFMGRIPSFMGFIAPSWPELERTREIPVIHVSWGRQVCSQTSAYSSNVQIP